MLEVKNITVFYGKFQAIKNVSLKIEEGTLTALIGPNGAGKTTLLRTISGVLKPRSGRILFKGKRIDILRPNEIPKLGIAHVPEGRHLFPHMTVLENLEVGAHLPAAKKKKEDTLRWVWQLFPILKERLNQRASTLSGGEQQMLAIARGLMLRPKIMLLDEPSLGLAPKLVGKLFDLLKQLHDEGITIFLVEQNVRQTLEIADYGYVLETGKIVLKDNADELIRDDEIRKAYIGI